jgi:hypothetical protein
VCGIRRAQPHEKQLRSIEPKAKWGSIHVPAVASSACNPAEVCFGFVVRSWGRPPDRSIHLTLALALLAAALLMLIDAMLLQKNE